MDAIQMAKDWLKTNDPYEPEDGYQARKIIEALINPWQPIETAPRDHSFIWLANSSSMRIGYWGYECDEVNGVRFRWCDMALSESMSPNSLRFTPTHWMPLPEPPK